MNKEFRITPLSEEEIAKASDHLKMVRAYDVVSNTDLTEGRGQSIVIGSSRSYHAALQFAHKKGVMGSDAVVSNGICVILFNNEYFRGEPIKTTEEHINFDRVKIARDNLIDKVKSLGLTDSDIRLLSSK